MKLCEGGSVGTHPFTRTTEASGPGMSMVIDMVRLLRCMSVQNSG